MSKEQIVSIGIDQSYQRIGISIFVNGKKKLIKSIQFGNESKTEKRIMIRNELHKIFAYCTKKSKNVTCTIERIRLFSRGFVNIDYIKSIGALNSVIIDVANEYDVKVYSVDTRAWKAQVVGTVKKEENSFGVLPEKWPTIKWCINNGWEKDILIEVTGRKKKGTFVRDEIRFEYDNDAADSAAIAYFTFIGNKEHLKLED